MGAQARTRAAAEAASVDALVYSLSLFVVLRSTRWKAIFKGTVMLTFGVLVLGEALSKTWFGRSCH